MILDEYKKVLEPEKHMTRRRKYIVISSRNMRKFCTMSKPGTHIVRRSKHIMIASRNIRKRSE